MLPADPQRDGLLSTGKGQTADSSRQSTDGTETRETAVENRRLSAWHVP